MQIKIRLTLVLLLAIASLTFTACSTPEQSSAQNSTTTANTATTSETNSATTSSSIAQSTPTVFSDLPRLEGKATVVLMVNKSPITIEVDGTNAPVTAGNFVDLVRRGFYDGLAFHRVVRDPQPFVVQGGDPQSKDPKFPIEQLGTGGFIDPATKQPRYIPLEIKPKKAATPIYSQTLQSAGISEPPALLHKPGAVAMARSQPPDSASSQFYIALTNLPFLDGNYAVFGYVTNGMNVVKAIRQGDRIKSAKVTSGIENLKLPK